METLLDSNDSGNGRVHLKNIFAGSFSSSLSRFFGQPFDVIKLRLQFQQPSRDILKKLVKSEGKPEMYYAISDGIRDIYFKEGVKGFWRGHTMSQFQGFFQGIGIFWTFEQVRPLLNHTPIATSPKLCNFMSGFITGTVVVTCLNPLEVLHTHVILRSLDQKISALKLAQELHAAEGVRAFFHGGYTTMLHVGTLFGCKFLFYNIICDIALSLSETDSRGKLPTGELMTAGAASGCLSHLVTYPLDFVKRRLQVKTSENLSVYRNPGQRCSAFIQCFRLVVRNDGFFALYRGVVPCLVKSAVTTAMQFSTYDKLRMWADNYF